MIYRCRCILKSHIGAGNLQISQTQNNNPILAHWAARLLFGVEFYPLFMPTPLWNWDPRFTCRSLGTSNSFRNYSILWSRPSPRGDSHGNKIWCYRSNMKLIPARIAVIGYRIRLMTIFNILYAWVNFPIIDVLHWGNILEPETLSNYRTYTIQKVPGHVRPDHKESDILRSLCLSSVPQGTSKNVPVGCLPDQNHQHRRFQSLWCISQIRVILEVLNERRVLLSNER